MTARLSKTEQGTPAPSDASEHERLKQEQTLIARFAACGHAVHRLMDGGFVVCRLASARHVLDFAELAAVAAQMGVSQRDAP